MTVVGRIQSLWRYPVKSMRGEELQEAFVGFAGVYGDRSYAFVSSGAPKGFPFFTGREKQELILYRPAYRHGEQMRKPSNLAEAEALGSGVTAVYPADEHLMVDVETPSGEMLSVDDPLLKVMLSAGLADRHELALLRSHRAMTDCRPISLFSTQTVQQLSDEVGVSLDQRRFRANLYIELNSGTGFGEDRFIGHTLQIGAKAAIAVVGRDSRCKMITLDPDTAQANPEIMRQLARNHEGKAGVYAAVLVEGSIRPGDAIAVLP